MMELLALPALIGLALAIVIFARKPHWAVVSILVLSIIDTWMIEPPSIKVGINFYLHDIAFIPLLLATIYRLVFKQEWPYASPLWIAVGAIIFVNILLGLKQFGTAAGVDGRNMFYYWAGTLYFMSFAYDRVMLDLIAKYWLRVCLALMAIVYFRFVAEFLHLSIAQNWINADPTGVRFRVINSSQAYLLSICVLMLFHRYILPTETAKSSRVLLVLFAVAVIGLQHRSVWAATLFGILSLFMLPGVAKHKLVFKFAVLGAVGMLMLLPLLSMGYLDNFIESILGQAEKATNLQTGTFGARRKAWEQIMHYWSGQDFSEQLFGDPFGGSYAGLPNSPHNFFFQSLLRVGLVGNFLIYFTYLAILAKLYISLVKFKQHRHYPILLVMLIAGQLAYYIPYAPHAEHGVILGIAFSMTKRKTLVS